MQFEAGGSLAEKTVVKFLYIDSISFYRDFLIFPDSVWLQMHLVRLFCRNRNWLTSERRAQQQSVHPPFCPPRLLMLPETAYLLLHG